MFSGIRTQTIRVFVAKMVAVPLIGVLVLAAIVLKPRIAAAEAASQTQAMLHRTSLTISLSSIVASAQLPWIVKNTADDLGLPPSLVRQTLGFDPDARTQKSDAEIEMFFADHSTDPYLLAKRDEWRVIRSGFDSAPGQEVFAEFSKFQAELRARWDLETEYASQSSTGSSALERDVEMVNAILAFSEANTTMYESLFAAVSDKSVEQTRQARITIAGAAAKHQAAQEVLKKIARHRRIDLGLEKLEKSTATKHLHQQINYVLNGQRVRFDAAGIGRITETVNGGLERNAIIEHMISKGLERSNESAEKLRVSTYRTLETTVALVLGLLLITAVIFVRVSRAMTRPLHALASRARYVAQGEFDVDSAPTMGPREIQVVSAVLDELVANLQRVQRQAGALATGAFDDVVFRESIPGPIGQMLATSVSRLSRSIREREELQERLADQATHDSLTGIPNRAAAMMALEQALARSSRRADQLAVMFVDLDDFKRANDQRGHAVGDEALRIAAARIQESVRSGDVVARLGGDEFLVVIESFDTQDGVRDLGQRIVNSILEPMEIEGGVVRIGASVGLAFPDGANDSASELLGRADLAMYQAKSNGRGRVVEFNNDLSKIVEERRTIEDAMAHALTNGELRLEYQPVVNTETEALRSLEALLRWDRPDNEMQSPARFIPILETSPLIIDVGRWVLCRAATEVQALRQRAEFASLCVAVNLSGRHLLHNTLIDDVKRALDQSGLPASALTVEITETSLVTDLATAVEHVKALRALGVRIAIDDFGTGYTSIGQLSRLPVNVLKIDRSFIDQIGVPSSRRIVELIIELGHTLDMEVVAEGVEDLTQLESLRALQCDAVQGYLFSEPVRPEALRSNSRLAVVL